MAKNHALKEQIINYFIESSVGTEIIELVENIKDGDGLDYIVSNLKNHSKQIIIIIISALVLTNTASEQISYLRAYDKYDLSVSDENPKDYGYDINEIVEEGENFGRIINMEWIAHSLKQEEYDVNQAVLSYLGIEADRIVNSIWYSRLSFKNFNDGLDAYLDNNEAQMHWLNLAYTSIIKTLKKDIIAPNIPDNVQEFLRYNGLYEINYDYSYIKNELSVKYNKHRRKSQFAVTDDVIDIGIANRNRRMKIYKKSLEVIGEHSFSLKLTDDNLIALYDTEYDENHVIINECLYGHLSPANVYDYSSVVSKQNGGLLK